MRLREQIVKANLLVREASYIAEELDKRTEYRVTLQIPASSLDANLKVRNAFQASSRYLKDSCPPPLPALGLPAFCPTPQRACLPPGQPPSALFPVLHPALTIDLSLPLCRAGLAVCVSMCKYICECVCLCVKCVHV